MSTLASLMVGLGLSATDYVKGLDTAEKKTATSAASIGAKLAAIGGKAIFAGAVAGVGAVVGAVVGGIKAVGDWASTLDNLGDVLGTNAQESAALAVAIQGVGGNVEGIASQMTILTRGLVDAKGEIGPTGKILDSLGISFQDANGNMLPTTDILTSVADKLAAMPDGLQKTALMTDLFGKSGKDLSDVMNALADGGLAAAGEKAAQLGLLLSEDTVNSSIEAGKAMATLKMAAQGFFVTIGAQLLPVLMPLLTALMAWGMQIMPQVQAGIVAVAGWIQSALIPGLQNFLASMQPVIAFLVANWQPIVLGMATLILGFIIPAFIAWAASAIAAAIATITALAPVILPILAIAAVVALLAAAWKGNWGGIQEKTAAVVAFITSLVQIFLATLRAWWEEHGAAIMAAAESAWTYIQGIIEMVTGIISSVVAAFRSAFEGDWYAFGENLRAAWDKAWELIKKIVSDAWTVISKAVSDLVDNVIAFITETDWPAVGGQVVKGLANGISGGVSWIAKAARSLAKAMIDAFKGALGLGSPSKLFMGFGEMTAVGFAEGLANIKPVVLASQELSVAAASPFAGATVRGAPLSGTTQGDPELKAMLGALKSLLVSQPGTLSRAVRDGMSRSIG